MSFYLITQFLPLTSLLFVTKAVHHLIKYTFKGRFCISWPGYRWSYSNSYKFYFLASKYEQESCILEAVVIRHREKNKMK